MNNKPLKIFGAVLFYLTFLSACSTIDLVSKKDPGFYEPISHVVITYKAQEPGDSLGFYFGKQLASLLEKRGASAEVAVFESTALLSDSAWTTRVRNQTKQMRLELINTTPMIHVPGRSDSFLDPGYYKGTFDIRLYIGGKSNPVWRSSISVDHSSDFLSFPNTGEKMAKKVFQQLEKDGLIWY